MLWGSRIHEPCRWSNAGRRMKDLSGKVETSCLWKMEKEWLLDDFSGPGHKTQCLSHNWDLHRVFLFVCLFIFVFVLFCFFAKLVLVGFCFMHSNNTYDNILSSWLSASSYWSPAVGSKLNPARDTQPKEEITAFQRMISSCRNFSKYWTELYLFLSKVVSVEAQVCNLQSPSCDCEPRWDM